MYAFDIVIALAEVRLALLVRPWRLKGKLNVDELAKACPEVLAAPDTEPRLNRVGVTGNYPHATLGRALCKATDADEVTSLGEAPLPSVVGCGRLRGVATDPLGRCTCGRAVRLLSECKQC